MTPQELTSKWGAGGPAYALNERAGAQPHFMDLCALLGVPTPGDADNYCFERGLTKTGTGKGYADVWMRGCFGWEYKAPGKSLNGALKQLMLYALPLDNPPLLVVSDRLTIEIHTHFTGTPSERHVIRLEELTRPDVQERLRWIFTAPDKFKPAKTTKEITEEAATTFAKMAERLREAGVRPEEVSHFLTQCLFCFFAEDVDLLPDKLFERLVGLRITSARLTDQLGMLFASMRDGGLFGAEPIAWFNGGLFQRIHVPPLSADDVKSLRDASGMNWSAIDPSIFGTLFERGLDPGKRSQLGAHYTDPATILRIVKPVVEAPLQAEWSRASKRIADMLEKRDRLREEAKTIVDKSRFARMRTQANEAEREGQAAFNAYLEKLKEFKVLDPACGSGNFLYLSLRALKDIEHRVNLEAEALGLQRQQDVTGPHNVLGIEVNEFAAELARVTVWIGELQWRLQHGYAFKTNPILEPLDCIETRDAILNADGTEAEWPQASVVVGNPPFLGDKLMRSQLGDAYTQTLRRAYRGSVPGTANLVGYWFEKAKAQIERSGLAAAGLVATNAIRQSANRKVLLRILTTTRIFDAWSDLAWVNEGASVRVSLICFGNSDQDTRLDGQLVDTIFADLRAKAADRGDNDLTAARILNENKGASFFGVCLAGPFVIDAATAREWLKTPNPHSRSNAEVLTPIWNGKDVTERSFDRWAVDFGASMTEADAGLFEKPFNYVRAHVHAVRTENNRASRAKLWWRHGEARPGLRKAMKGLNRCIVTVERAKHRVFMWMPVGIAGEHRLVVITRADDVTMGLVSSRFHVTWALAAGSTLTDRPGYNTQVCFLPFPFPVGLTPADTSHCQTQTLDHDVVVPAGVTGDLALCAYAIGRAAKRLDDLRDRWLNPVEWTERLPEIVPLGMSSSPYPSRIVPRPGHEVELAKRTLTKLYNERPAWLVNAHEAVDAAVAAGYGWTDYTPAMTDEEILGRLLALNFKRTGVKIRRIS